MSPLSVAHASVTATGKTVRFAEFREAKCAFMDAFVPSASRNVKSRAWQYALTRRGSSSTDPVLPRALTRKAIRPSIHIASIAICKARHRLCPDDQSKVVTAPSEVVAEVKSRKPSETASLHIWERWRHR